LVGVDRLDVSKGLPLRLNAYRELLATRPSHAALPHYLQFITPSRSDLLANQLLQREIQSAASAINSPYAGTGSAPLCCVFEALEQAQLMTLLAAADVGLVTPLKDGMNLLAKEFIAAQPPTNPGVLVLSKHAGAARELDSALLVEPRDIRAVAMTIAKAIDMPLIERQERHQALLAALQRHQVSHWHTAFVERLREIAPR
jgi:trehalose 6-phosphate synthase